MPAFNANKPIAFVIMPFGDGFDEFYELFYQSGTH